MRPSRFFFTRILTLFLTLPLALPPAFALREEQDEPGSPTLEALTTALSNPPFPAQPARRTAGMEEGLMDPRGRWRVVGGWGAVDLIHPSNGKLVRWLQVRVQGRKGAVRPAAISSDGRWLAVTFRRPSRLAHYDGILLLDTLETKVQEKPRHVMTYGLAASPAVFRDPVADWEGGFLFDYSSDGVSFKRFQIHPERVESESERLAGSRRILIPTLLNAGNRLALEEFPRMLPTEAGWHVIRTIGGVGGRRLPSQSGLEERKLLLKELADAARGPVSQMAGRGEKVAVLMEPAVAPEVSAAGAEEIEVKSKAELAGMPEADAKELAAQAAALGATDVLLIPSGLLKEEILPPKVKIHLYAHKEVMAGAYTVLPISIRDVDSLQIHELPEDPERARALIGEIPKDQMAVVALDARFKEKVEQFFPDPRDHPLTFLMTPGKWEDYLNYRKEIAALLSRPIGQRRNLILFLSAGSVVQRQITIGDKTYGAAIFA